MVSFVEQRWESALEASSPQLTAEVTANARHAQQVVGSYYAKGLELGTAGADAMVNQFVKLAEQGVNQVAANASLFEEKTGITAFKKLSVAAVPAAQAVGKLVSKIEQKSEELASKIAESPIFSSPVPAASPFRKARARKAA